MKRRTLVAFLLVCALVSLSAAQDKPVLPPDLAKGLAAIQGTAAYGYVKQLSSPAFAGRLTGSDGYTAAAKWAAALYKQWGLKPVDAKTGYLQPYPSPYTIIKSAELTLFLPGDSAGKKLEANKEYLPLLFSDSGRIEAGLIFAGWGISAPDLGYDDYAGLDVKGKIVLCFRGQPAPRDPRFQHHDEHRTRMKTAQDKGALGLFYIYPEPISNPNGDWLKDFLPAMISEKTADTILKEAGTTSADLKKILQTFKKPLSFALQSKVRYTVESEHHADGVGYNVAGYVEGSDPVLRKEVVVIGGHFDHDGFHMGFLFPGADDNASGSATVMEIGRAYSTLARQPKRSVVFVLFGGEEMGLQGSTYFVEHVPAPFTKIDGMFNFDMTGEGDGAWGSASVDGLKAAVEKADKSVGILRGMSKMSGPVGVRGSDFAPFYEKGAATAMIGSNGPHLAYHAVGDTIYRINPEIMADIAKVAFLSSFDWANR
jgi:hypothetical protein